MVSGPSGSAKSPPWTAEEAPQRRRTFLTVAAGSRRLACLRGRATRGGTLTSARPSDCIYLDPVHTSQNADIWISLNIHDTLIQPTPDGKSVAPAWHDLGSQRTAR